MIEYIRNNYLELAGTLLSLIYLYLSVRQKVSLWLFGFLSALCYMVVFWESRLYAVMTLQVYYLVISVYGWISWKRGAVDGGSELPVRKTTSRQALVLSVLTALLFIIYYFVLVRLTDSALPIADSLMTAGSIIATWMLARKLIEHWLLWIIIDLFSVGVYLYQEMYSTAILYIVYTVMAVVGYFSWRKSLR